MNVIEIENLTYSYPGASSPTLNNITLQIEKGDFLAIIGNNGCGKSTLCKTINGLIPHFITGEFQGKVMVGGIDTRESDVGTLARKVGYVYQDFENQIVRPVVLDDAYYACMNYAMSDYKERGLEALKKCGLIGKENDYIWQLSGGQTHLLALAGAVSLQPDVLILDEPIAQLDPSHARQIYEVLKELNETYGKTIIVIEHHTEYIADYCKHVLLLKDGYVKWKLPADEALRRVDELEECNIFPPQVTIAAHRMKERGMYPETLSLPTTIEEGKKVFCIIRNQMQLDGLKQGPNPKGQLQSKEMQGPPTMNQVKQQDREGSLNHKYQTNSDHINNIYGEDVIASFKNVSISYPVVKGSPYRVFRDLNLDIKKGEKIALIGSNGAGKSTLMKLMTGLVKASAGEVLLKGRNIKNTKPEMLSRLISLVYQNPEEMFIKDSIKADISYAMKVRNEVNWERRTEELLERFRLTELKDKDGRLLSGGQMRRASLAIGIALNPEILLLDEPTANLDMATRKEIMSTLNDMKHITETVIIATHDMQLVCDWAERIIVLCEGEVVADGSRNEIFGDTKVIEQVGIRPPEIFTLGQELSPHALCYTIDEFISQLGGC